METDDGAFGQVGPVAPETAWLARQRLARHVVGRDARAVERIWDVLYRTQAHGWTGLLMHAISAVDCALWDLAGRAAGAPVYRLLGGPTRDRIEAYAQTKGMRHHPEHLLAEATALVEAGWRRLKVFFRHGPGDGLAGMRENERVVRTLREGLPEDVEMMADAWRGWDASYAREMLRRLEPLGLRWLEELLRPEFAAGCARLRREFRTPIACGEHAYARWGHAALLGAGAADVLQPDVTWAGGLTEARKIVVLASAAGVEVSPHTNLLEPTVHLLAAVSPGEATLLEYPVYDETYLAPFFLARRSRAEGGAVPLPEGPGLGMDWDESKIEAHA